MLIVWRAVQKASITHWRVSFFDPKTQTEPGITYERRAFRRAQKQDPLFEPSKLLFCGETLIYLISDNNFHPLQRTLLLMFALRR